MEGGEAYILLLCLHNPLPLNFYKCVAYAIFVSSFTSQLRLLSHCTLLNTINYIILYGVLISLYLFIYNSVLPIP